MNDTAVLPKPVQESILSYFKVAVAAASIIAPYFLFNFLFVNKIPVPSDAQSFLFMLPAFALVGLMLSLYLAAAIFLPAITVHTFGLDMREIFYGKGARRVSWNVIFSYLKYHGITGVWLAGVNIYALFFESSPKFAFLSFLALSLCVCLVAYRDFRGRGAFKLAAYIFFVNLVFLFWFVIGNVYIELSFKPLSENKIFYAIASIFILFGSLAFHFFQVVPIGVLAEDDPKKNSRLGIIFLVAAFALALLPQVAAFIGGASLNIFGIGGDKRIRIEPSDDGASRIPDWAKAKDGVPPVILMALDMPSHIYIRKKKGGPVIDAPKDWIKKIDFVSKKGEVEFTRFLTKPDSGKDSNKK